MYSIFRDMTVTCLFKCWKHPPRTRLSNNLRNDTSAFTRSHVSIPPASIHAW